jgi:hypothetical protein
MENVITQLLQSEEPSVRYRALVGVLGRDPGSREAKEAREAVRVSARVGRLLSLREAEGRTTGSAYAKFTGAHWVLGLLADLGYPPGDPSLLPLRDQVYEAWLAPGHVRERVCESKAASYGQRGVPIMQGRARRCGSQEGNALYATLALGLADERANQLAANLIRWQWPDGGWNCDRNPAASHASFHETLLPLRGLALHARVTGSAASRQAAERAAEVFLKRGMFRRRRDGAVIHPEFVKLHYPCYWHYDLLFGLKVMVEAGFLHDSRCSKALELLESKRLPGGGFPAEGRYYKVVEEPENGGSLVDWGGTSKQRMNAFVTVDALSVLKAAGRLGGVLSGPSSGGTGRKALGTARSARDAARRRSRLR